VRSVNGHLPKASREKETWQHIEAELKKAARRGHGKRLRVAPHRYNYE